MTVSKSKLIFSIVALIWMLSIALIPITAPAGSIDLGNSGIVSRNDFSQLYNSINPYGRVVYYTGDVLCHQHASRSFFINGNQMPYCARCTGIFFGISVSACAGIFFYFVIKWYWIVISLLPIGIDGTGQLFSLWESTNWLRFLTGTAAGIIGGIAVCVILQELVGIHYLRKEKNPEPAGKQ